MTIPTYRDIENAARLLYGHIIETPTVYTDVLSREFKADVYLKLESLQKTNSFKVRGSGVKILSMSDEERQRGIICASAGNHAQGVAYHAQALGIEATVVMPEPSPRVKIIATESYGAEVILHGKIFDDAYAHAQKIAKEKKRAFVHPFNDAHIIAGQGTVGLEVFNQVKNLDYIIVPIGGGGLMAGICIAIKSLNPKTRIIGVQTESAPNAHRTFYGKPTVSLKPSIAEGIAAKVPGDLCMRVIKKHVEDIFTVKEDTIKIAINKLHAKQKLVTEGAAAASIAMMLENPDIFVGKRVCAIISGGNIDPRRVSDIILND